MKKALVVFLILAVAGGLFAEVSFSGSVETGIAIGFTDQKEGNDTQLGEDGKPIAADKAVIDFIQNRGDHGMRARINASASGENDFGTYGASLALGVESGLWKGMGTWFDSWYLWWEPSALLNLRIGKGGQYDFGSLAGSGNLVRTWEPGLYILSKPIDNLQIGGQVFYGADHNNSSGILDELRYGLGVKYSLPSLLDINAQLQARTKDDPLGLYFIAGAKFNGVPGLGIAAELGGYDFNNSKNNAISIGEKIDFSTGGLSLSARAQQLLAMGTELDDSFMPMLFHGEIGYKVSDVVSVGVQGRYLIGKGPNWNWRNAGELGNFDIHDFVPSKGVFDKDNKAKALGISPEINFSLGGPSIKLGYNLQMDMSDGASGDPKKVTSSTTDEETGITTTKEWWVPSKSLQHLIYVQFNVSF